MNADADFIEEYRPLVRSIAHRVRRLFDLETDLDDLLAWGFSGLIEAKGRYDASRGVQFNTFAYYRIRGAMIDGVRKSGFLTRRAYVKMKAAEAALAIGEEVAESRAADPQGRTEHERTAETLRDTLSKLTASFAMASVGQPVDHAIRDTAEDQLILDESCQRVREAMKKLPERELALVQGFYFDGRQFDDVAKDLGISKSWASRLHTKALKILREAMES